MRYWYVIETLTRTDLGVRNRASNLAAVLLAQAGAGIQSAHTGRIPGPSGDDPGTLSSEPCPLPNLTANAPTLSDQYGNNAAAGNTLNVLGAGSITIKGAINNNGTVPTAHGAFGNRFDYRVGGSKPGPWELLQTVSLTDTATALGAGKSRAVKEHSWTGGVGTWEFQLFADSADVVPESNETIADNASAPTTVEIVDFTPTLTPNPATGLVGDTVTFTADSVLYGILKDKTQVSYANFKCDTSGTPAPIPLTATSFSCTYTTAGAKTASVSALYYRIPKSATAPVTITPKPLPDLVARITSINGSEPPSNYTCASSPFTTAFANGHCPNTFEARSSIAVNGEIQNVGTDSTLPSTATLFYQSGNNGPVKISDQTVKGLTPGEKVALTAISIPRGVPSLGTANELPFTVILRANSGTLPIDESNAGNNDAARVIRRVRLLTPTIQFTISPGKFCGTGTVTQIPRSQIARLCWTVVGQ